MRTFKCHICGYSFCEADKSWDAAVESGQCPECLERLRNFPVPTKQEMLPPLHVFPALTNPTKPQPIPSQISSSNDFAAQPHFRAVGVSAAKWALVLSVGFVLGSIVIDIAGGGEMAGKVLAEKLVIGIACFPILFFGLWAWGKLSKKDLMTGIAIQRVESMSVTPTTMPEAHPLESTPSKKPSPWNHVAIGVGVFMLLFLFLPQIINGTLANPYYLGAAFWIGVVIYGAVNISRSK